MNTYLVHGYIQKYEYMNRSGANPTQETRLVKANTPEEAEAKFIKYFEVDNPYGTSRRVTASAYETIE